MSEEFIGDDDEEVIIGDDEGSPTFIGPSSNSTDIQNPTPFLSLSQFLRHHIEYFQNLLPNFQPELSESIIKFKIPSNLLPSSLRMVCGFYILPTLLDVTLTFQTPTCKSPLSTFKADHPYYHSNYIGRPIIYDTIRSFFTNTYSPKREYRSISILFPDDETNDQINYNNQPLIYLVLEILDGFLDIQDHCCICRKKLPFSVIKPSICDQKLCEVSFNEIGVGASVVQEIRRDPRAADLLLSLFACSTHDERYMKPKPPDELNIGMHQVFETLPDMMTIAQTCKNDADIFKNFGEEALDFLRWVILSNKSQLIHLPPQLRLKEVPFKTQFMSLIASPEKESLFQFKKKKLGTKKIDGKKKMKQQNNNNVEVGKSVLRWHGSSGERWHSIFRNGLKNMSNTDCVNGAWFGPGIYLANDASMSLRYTHTVENLYRNSMFGSSFTLIALCEVVPNNYYKDFGNFATLQDDDAIIVRFVFPIDENDFDLQCNANAIKKESIPTIDDVLEFLEKKDYNK